MGHLSANPQPSRNLIILRRQAFAPSVCVHAHPADFNPTSVWGRYTTFDPLHETGRGGYGACGGLIGVRPTLIRDDLPLIFVARRTEIVREMEQVL